MWTFTRFRHLTDFQETNKCNSCFVTILNILQVKYCFLGDRYVINNVYKQTFLIKNDYVALICRT